jgi:predicted PhzF superfamily epimerase YddE/YHI9
MRWLGRFTPTSEVDLCGLRGIMATGRGEAAGYHFVSPFFAPAAGGVVRVRVAGHRVQLGGHAVTVFRGELLA